MEKIYLKVHFKEKDEAKKLGAKWDNLEKLWFITGDNINLDIFKFLPVYNIYAPIYLIESFTVCWKCSSPTPVYAFQADSYIDLYDLGLIPEEVDEGEDKETIKSIVKNEINSIKKTNYIDRPIILSDFDIHCNKKISEFMTNYSSYRQGYSHTLKSNCFANFCVHCNSLQGNFFLHNEPDSPFAPDLSTGKYNFRKKIIINDGILALNCDVSI
jgi:hypothetical protein